MIVDFQHHFIPRELSQEPTGTKTGIRFDKDGVPSMTPNAVLYDLDEHIRMMDTAGIDAAFLTVPPAMCADMEVSRIANDKTQAAVKAYPGRFIGGAQGVFLLALAHLADGICARGIDDGEQAGVRLLILTRCPW